MVCLTVNVLEESCFRFVQSFVPSSSRPCYLAPSFALAQNASVISGTVKDSSGGVLPGVSVKITNETTNTSADIVTTPEGTYTSETLDTRPVPRVRIARWL